MKAVVVLSGGQDSATALALAVRRYGREQVAALTFSYGQRHVRETACARHLAEEVFKIAAWQCLSLDFYSSLTSNALFSPELKIESACGAKCPNTVVEGRNAIFLQLAAVWAKSLGAREVWIGVSETDFSGYPDCRAVFVRAQQRALRLALDYPLRIVTPFMTMTKADEWALADELGIFEVVANETVTCYNGIMGNGCGACPACRLRQRGLQEYLRRKKATLCE